MADILDPTLWSTIVQTIVLSLTLVIFALSFRSQNKAIQEQAYQKVMDDYGDAMRMLSERPELYVFQLELFNVSGRRFGQEQSHTLARKWSSATMSSCFTDSSKESISSTDGNGLTRTRGSNGQRFLKLLPHTPVFRDVHQSSREMFDKPFQDYVSGILSRKK